MESYKTLGYLATGVSLAIGLAAAIAYGSRDSPTPETTEIHCPEKHQKQQGLGGRLKLAMKKRSRLISELE